VLLAKKPNSIWHKAHGNSNRSQMGSIFESSNSLNINFFEGVLIMKWKKLILTFLVILPVSGTFHQISASYGNTTFIAQKNREQNKLELCYIAQSFRQIEDLEFVTIVDYKALSRDAGQGYGAKWQNKDNTLDLYLYDLNYQNIGKSLDSPLVQAALDSAIKGVRYALQMGIYQKADIGVTSTRQFGEYKFLFVPMKFIVSGRQGESVIILTVLQGRFFKVRLTSFEENPTQKIERILTKLPQLIPTKSKVASNCPTNPS
jgi:hypothetical protein